MDLAQIRSKALNRIKERRWSHAVSLEPKLADAASEAQDAVTRAERELERYQSQPPEAKAAGTRSSGDPELKRLKGAVEDAQMAAALAQTAADEQTVHLTFQVLTPDEYQAELFKAANGQGEFDLGPFTLALLEKTYIDTRTGPGGKDDPPGEDLTLSWDEARNIATHGEVAELQSRVIEENRRIDSFPS